MFKKAMIVVLLFLVIFLIGFVFWLQPRKAANELLFVGGTIITMTEDSHKAEAVLVQDGNIVDVGSRVDMQAKASKAVDIIDLEGATLVPGLVEPHTHAVASAMLGATIDVSGFSHRSRQEVMQSLGDGISSSGYLSWITAFGWDPVLVDDLEPPTLAELDAISPDKPLIILTQMMHEAYVNSAALRATGITKDTPNPHHGSFKKDDEGELTGVIHEVGAINFMFDAMPKTSPLMLKLLQSLQFQKYAKAGYTTIGVVGPANLAGDSIVFLKQIAQRPDSPIRVRVYATESSGVEPVLGGNENFAVRGIKFWIDGSPFAGGAAWAEPYENSNLILERLGLPKDHMAPLGYSDETLQAQVMRFHQNGHQLSFHVQGERAAEQALNAIDKALKAYPRADHRHRIEHAALITKAQLERAKALGMTVSFFTDHIYYYGDKLPYIVGEERLKRYMPLATALKAGLRISFHGDHPATPIDPFRTYKSATTRLSMISNSVIAPQEAISRLSALRAMTIDAAWQLGMEEIVGTIEKGKRADFTILDKNPLEVSDDDLSSITVLETWKSGKPTEVRKVTWGHIKLVWDIIWDKVWPD